MKTRQIMVIAGVLIEPRFLGAVEADTIARANGYEHAEQFVRRYSGKTLWIAPSHEVTTSRNINNK